MSANARVIIEYESGVRAVGPILRLEGQGIQVGLTSDALEGPVTVWLPGSGSLGSIRFASFARAKGNSVFLSTDRLGARGRQRLRELQERAAAGELSEMRSPPGTSADSDERARSRTPIPRAGGVVERVRRPATSEPDEKAAPAAAAVRREHSTAPAAVNRMPSAAPAAAPVRPP